MFDYSCFSCATLMECGSELRGGTVLGLKRCQVYKRKAKRAFYGCQDTGAVSPRPPRTRSQMQLLSGSAPTEKSFRSETAPLKVWLQFSFPSRTPVQSWRPFFFFLWNRVLDGTSSPPAQIDSHPFQLYPDLLNHNKLSSSRLFWFQRRGGGGGERIRQLSD